MKKKPPAKINRKRNSDQRFVAGQTRHLSQISPLKPLDGYIRKATLPVSLLLGLHTGNIFAGPQGEQIVGGQGNIARPDGTTTTINQQSHRLAIDWTSFNVNTNELVQFKQPSTSASALNRIFDQNPSQIHGAIRANGNVLLVNPSGVFFGPTASIEVGSLVASGLNISTTDFMAGLKNFEAPYVCQESSIDINRRASGPSAYVFQDAIWCQCGGNGFLQVRRRKRWKIAVIIGDTGPDGTIKQSVGVLGVRAQ